jgi:hypothetical protein
MIEITDTERMLAMKCPSCGESRKQSTTVVFDCGSYYNAKGRFIKSYQCGKVGKAQQEDCDKRIFDKNISDAQQIMRDNVRISLPDIKAFLDQNKAINEQGMVNFHWTYIKLLIESYVENLITDK